MSDQQDAIKHAAPLTNQRLIRSAMVVMAGFLLTKLVSLGQVFLIADKFGASSEYDAFVLANSVPENLIKFIGVGALSVAFIPFFSGLLNREDPEGAWRLASQLFNTLLVVTVTASVLVFLIAPFLVEEVVAPGFDSQSQIDLTVNNMRILLLSTIIFTLSSLLTGVLNGHNHFFLTVVAPIFFDLGLLFGVIFFTDSMGVYGLAWGTVLGALLHFSIQIPGLFMFQARWYPALGWRDNQLHRVIILMIPRMLASFVFTVNFIFIGRIASQLGEGAPSAFNWGLRIMDIPEALIGTALGFVIFPTLAALNELGDVEERRRVFSQAVRFILLATIPAAAGMILIGKPAVDILFADPEEAALVYAVVQVMAFAMVLQSVHEVVARAFYAQKDTIRPLIFSVAGMVVTIIVLYTFYFIYEANGSIPLASPFGVGITGLGYLAAFITELSLLTIVLRRQWQDIDGENILDTIGRTLAATLIMAVPVYLVDYILATNVFTEGGRVAGVIRAGVGGVVGSSVFIASALLFNIEEVKQLPTLFRRRRRKKQEATSAA